MARMEREKVAGLDSNHPASPRPPGRTLHPGWLGAALAVLAVAFVLGLRSEEPPAPRPASAAGTGFSAERALQLLEGLLGDGSPHPIGTAANARVRERIVAQLTELGYDAQTQGAFACRAAWSVCGRVENVLARLPGSTAGPAVLLTAHYDSVGAGPGAADDLAGVAVVLEVARLLRAEAPLRNPVIFLLSDGEEVGLLGAEAFTTHPWAAEVGLVVNLEARGTRGASLLFETSPGNARLIGAFAAEAPKPVTNSVLYEIYKYLPNDSDFTVYREAGLAGVNFAFVDEVAHYHTPLDDPARLDPRSLQHHGDNALAAVRAFASPDPAALAGGDSVFMNLVPGTVFQLPAPWALGVALACLLAWLALATTLALRREASAGAVAWGSLAALLGLVGAALLGLAVTELVLRLTGAPVPWYAVPLPTRAAVWAGALLGVGLAVTAFARRAGFWGLSAGVWLWWSLLATLTAWLLPGVSVLFLPPLAVAAALLGAVASTRWRASAWAPGLATLAAAFATGYIWLPFSLALEAGDGLALSPAIGLGVGMAASAAAPLLALPHTYRRVRAWGLAATAALSVAALAWALAVPPFTEERPHRVSIMHFEDHGTGAARWLLDAFPALGGPGVPVPPELQEVVGFGAEPAARLPWSDRPLPAAPAPFTGQPAPRAEVITDERSGGERVVRLRLHSPRGADRLSLYLPVAAALRRIEVSGTPYAVAPGPVMGGYHRFECHGAACSGLELALHLGGGGPLRAIVADTTFGLPPAGAALVGARPRTAVPSQDGDVSVVAVTVDL